MTIAWYCPDSSLNSNPPNLSSAPTAGTDYIKDKDCLKDDGAGAMLNECMNTVGITSINAYRA
jgi:hypothetical protein